MVKIVACNGCGAEGATKKFGGGAYCDSCWLDNVAECQGCFSVLRREGTVEFEDNVYCAECYPEHAAQCEGCSRDFLKGNLLETESGLYCKRCARRIAEAGECEAETTTKTAQSAR